MMKYTLLKKDYDSIPSHIKDALNSNQDQSIKLTEYNDGFQIMIESLAYEKQNGASSKRTARGERVNNWLKSPSLPSSTSVIISSTALGLTAANAIKSSIFTGAAAGLGVGAFTVATFCCVMYCVGKNKAPKGKAPQELVTIKINEYEKKNEKIPLSQMGVQLTSNDVKNTIPNTTSITSNISGMTSGFNSESESMMIGYQNPLTKQNIVTAQPKLLQEKEKTINNLI